MPEARYHSPDEPPRQTSGKQSSTAPRSASQAAPASSPSSSGQQGKDEPKPGDVSHAEPFGELKTSLSWTPSLHDRRFQLRALAVLAIIGSAYLFFHYGLTVNTKLAVSAEQQRMQDLFRQCLDHNTSTKQRIFSGTVQPNPSAGQDSAAQPREALAQFGGSYTFTPWSDLSKLPDPTIFVGKLASAGGIVRLVIVTVDVNPPGARVDTGNVGIHVSTYSADLPLTREAEGESQLNIYLKQGATFQAFEASRDAKQAGVSFDIEADKRRASLHVRLQPDGTTVISDDANQITHETVVYELDLTGPA